MPKITEGILNAKTLRNLDCINKGIKGKFTVGYKTVAYPVRNVIEFLEEKVQKTGSKGGMK
ncbi:MAG: hypothetical protein LBC04_01580 [Holosporaceae bacterium]|nr:hypothetical protein [Holosporaceae bacterium]